MILAVLDAVDVGASDLHRRADAAEPFSHEQCNALVAGEHVEQLEFVLPSRQWSRMAWMHPTAASFLAGR